MALVIILSLEAQIEFLMIQLDSKNDFFRPRSGFILSQSPKDVLIFSEFLTNFIATKKIFRVKKTSDQIFDGFIEFKTSN